MTRMAETDGPEHAYDEEPPRSIFSAMWFRALIVILVLGVIAAVAVPYVLDFVNPPVVRIAASTPARPASPPPAAKATELPPASATPPSATGAPMASIPAATPPTAAAAIPSKPMETTKPADALKPAETMKPGADTAKMATAADPAKPAVA